MGTLHDLIEVAVGAVFFGGALLLGQVLWNRYNRLKPALTSVEIVGSVMAGLGLGIVMTFPSSAFHWPLAALTIPALLSGVFAVRSLKRKSSL